MCSTNMASSPIRITHRITVRGTRWPPRSRSASAYSLIWVGPSYRCRLPIMCTITKASSPAPVTAITYFLPTAVW